MTCPIPSDNGEELEDNWEDYVYEAQAEWLEKHYPQARTNDGWFVDEVMKQVGTKVYGHGVLTSTYSGDGTISHTFEER